MRSILEEDRAILRRVAFAVDLQHSWRDACRVREELRIRAILEAVVLVRQDRRDVIDLVAGILRLDWSAIRAVLISRSRCRVGDRGIAVDALDRDFDWSRRIAIDRRELRIAIDNILARDRVRRDRHRVHPRVVQRVVAQHIAVTRERFFERIRRVARIIRTGIAIEICSTVVFVVNFDVVYVTVDQRPPRREAMRSILEEDRAILRRVAFAVDLQRSWRDARLAIHERDVVVVQRIECTFRSIRERQQIVIAYVFRPPASRGAIKCSIIVVLNCTKTCCQRIFRIAIDQVLASLSAVGIAIPLLIKRRTIDRLSIADIDNQIRLVNCSIASQNFRIVVFQVIIKEVSTIRRFKTDHIPITSIRRPNIIFTISSSGIHVLSRKQAQFTTEACVQGFSRIAIDNAVRVRVGILRRVKCRAIRGADVANLNLQLRLSNLDMSLCRGDVIVISYIMVICSDAIALVIPNIICVEISLFIRSWLPIDNLIRRLTLICRIHTDPWGYLCKDITFLIPRNQTF